MAEATIDALREELARLRVERKAVLLVHNYQNPEVQDIGDILGDSLGLSRQAAATDAEVIVFCGVHFMAQTAKLLSPQKMVLLPEIMAGCPMADMITPEQLADFRKDVVIELYNEAGQKVLAYKVYRCWVSEYDALPELDRSRQGSRVDAAFEMAHMNQKDAKIDRETDERQ